LFSYKRNLILTEILATIKCNLQRHSKYLLYDRLNFLQRLTVILLTIILFAIAPNASSTSFTIADGVFVTSQQTLSSNETGTINSGGDLTTSVTAIYANSASNITVLNSGAITTSGTSSYGIHSLSNSGTSTFTNSGTITTSGQYGYGIHSRSNSGITTATNTGTITTSGQYGYGIHSNQNSDASTLTNSGTITTSGTYGYGVFLNNNTGTSTLTNSGTITTSGSSGNGIYLRSNSGITTANTGTITTSGQYGYGVLSLWNSGTLTISNTSNDTISTSGSSSYGMYSYLQTSSGTSTLTNSGTITTSGSSGYGIYSRSNSGITTATNTGTITTSGSANHGMYSYLQTSSGTSTLTNSGTITTSGRSGNGIYLRSNSGITTATNTGTITTSGQYGDGVFSFLNSDTVNFTNSGTITTTGASGHGVSLNSNTGPSTITNSGTIKVTGSGSVGIKTDRAGTINNSGTISATGDATKAIEATGNYDNTLNLLSGSNITGTIDLGGGTDTVNISGTQVINGCQKSACMSASLFTNAEVINIDSSVDAVVSSGVVATVDPTGSSVLGVSLSTMTSAVHDVVSQRMARTSRMPVSGRGLSSWGQTIGAYRSRGTEGSAMGHNHSYVGFTGGTEKKLKQGRVGVMAGYASSSVSTKEMSNSTNTNSFFGGIYGDLYLGRQVSLTTSLLGGYEYHDNTRNVRNGSVIQDAKSDFSSTFFSPSVTLSSTHPFEIAGRQFAFRPSTTAVYTISQYDNYQEKGTTGSNLAVSDRTVQALKIRTQLAVAMSLNKHSEFELRSGFTTRHTDHDDIKAALGSTNFQIASAGNNSVQGGFVGGSLRLHATDNLRASVDVKFRGAGGRESEFIGRAGVSYSF